MQPNDVHHITPQLQQMYEAAWAAMPKWQGYIIGIDGRDGAGKSTAARFLAWKAGMPAIETDLLLNGHDEMLRWDVDILKLLINRRLEDDRPVIVEGVCLLENLEGVGRKPDFLVYVVNETFVGCEGFRDQISSYEKRFKPSERADFTLVWNVS